VVAIIEIPELKPERVRKILSEWFEVRRLNTVTFKEEINPENERYPDYFVVYKAVFEPHSLSQARVEIWLTNDGDVSIGFETWKRIAERLGIKGGNVQFAAGHEPARISETNLLAILDLMADGQIAISATVMPFFGLVSTNAVILQEILEELVSKGYFPVNWLKGVSQKKFSSKGNLLSYYRWGI
jgi:hypothetical protein